MKKKSNTLFLKKILVSHLNTINGGNIPPTSKNAKECPTTSIITRPDSVNQSDGTS